MRDFEGLFMISLFTFLYSTVYYNLAQNVQYIILYSKFSTRALLQALVINLTLKAPAPNAPRSHDRVSLNMYLFQSSCGSRRA
jgi:hypothetical protein